MITVTHEKVVGETFRLIELGAYFKGHQICLKVKEPFTKELANRTQEQANKMLADYISGRWMY